MSTDEEKASILRSYFRNNDQIRFEGLQETQQEPLTEQLIQTLLADELLCGKVIHTRTGFILHAGTELPADTPTYAIEGADHDIFVHVAMGQDDIEDAIDLAMTAAVGEQEALLAEHGTQLPLSKPDGSVTGSQLIIGSGTFNEVGKSAINPDLSARRGDYDPRALELHEGRAHTSGHLKRNGLLRTSEDKNDQWLWKLGQNSDSCRASAS